MTETETDETALLESAFEDAVGVLERVRHAGDGLYNFGADHITEVAMELYRARLQAARQEEMFEEIREFHDPDDDGSDFQLK